MRLRLLSEAQQEIEEAAAWYQNRQPGLGADFLEAVGKALTLIEQSPERFALLETMPVNRNVRRCVLHRFPYAVIYEVLAEETLVAAVGHAARDPDYWKSRR